MQSVAQSNEFAARRAACRVGPPGSSFFASDDILLKSIFVRKVRLGRLEMRAGAIQPRYTIAQMC